MASKRKPAARPAPPASSAPNDGDARREAIALALLSGEDAEAVIAAQAAAGMNAAAARYEVEKALKSPYLAAGRRMADRLAKRDWVLATQRRLATMDPDAATVPVVDAISPAAFYRDFYYPARPVKLTGLIDHWPARIRWSLDDLGTRLGSARVEVQTGREANPDFEIAKDAHRTTVPLRDVITRLRAGPSNDFYLTAYNSGANKVALSPLWDDVGDVAILAKREVRDGFLWIGPQGTITPFHHDLTSNLLLQIVGRKRVKLVAPHDTPLMRNHLHCFSAWDGADLPPGPGDAVRPRVLECTIGPGEALFLPIGWWHHVEGLDVTMGMSFTNFAAPNDFHEGYRSYGAM